MAPPPGQKKFILKIFSVTRSVPLHFGKRYAREKVIRNEKKQVAFGHQKRFDRST